MGRQEVSAIARVFAKGLTYLYTDAQKRGLIESDLSHLTDNDFELGDTLVRELMVPRTEMVWVERDKTLRQALSLALRLDLQYELMPWRAPYSLRSR